MVATLAWPRWAWYQNPLGWVFSSCIFRQILDWRDKWCRPSICGGRPGKDALSLAIDLGLSLEEAKPLAKRGVSLVSLDLSKFFDSIEWGLIRGLSLELGMPPRMVDTFNVWAQASFEGR